MARLVVRGGELVVRLTWWEKLAARHGDVHVPIGAVERVTVDASWWRVLRGTPGRGTWIPDVLSVGVRNVTGLDPSKAEAAGLGPSDAHGSRAGPTTEGSGTDTGAEGAEGSPARDFVALRPRSGPVVCVDLLPNASPYARLSVTDRAPDATAATVRMAVYRAHTAPPPSS
ncbi:hypothetical protein [Streptomyces cavernicola]|uniref:Uncharacterized protein n=1 Tax=Streptomyces cavernicola TaxID=3043613 RepID=A0ABT6SL42_9ACTN|nr:hypothetical protein [Streptomyces sp. B-S-A6]MDI3408113.1 hypothetical protein [Streptomyces sp. B-S-A6]